jgi:hypothetical protein
VLLKLKLKLLSFNTITVQVMKTLKTLIPFIWTLLFVLVYNSCSDKEIDLQGPGDGDEVPEIKLKKEEVMPLIEGYPFFVSGKDSVEITTDPFYETYRNNVFLMFMSGSVMFYGGSSLTNTEFQPSAKTFTLNTRIALPTSLKYHWDDVDGTLVVESSGISSYLPVIVSDKIARVDKSGVRLNKTMEEAKAATVPGKIRFIYKDSDPKLGEVTYKVYLKPLWQYYKEPGQQVFAKFVVF